MLAVVVGKMGACWNTSAGKIGSSSSAVASARLEVGRAMWRGLLLASTLIR
jgi:hypothetical protein